MKPSGKSIELLMRTQMRHLERRLNKLVQRAGQASLVTNPPYEKVKEVCKSWYPIVLSASSLVEEGRPSEIFKSGVDAMSTSLARTRASMAFDLDRLNLGEVPHLLTIHMPEDTTHTAEARRSTTWSLCPLRLSE